MKTLIIFFLLAFSFLSTNNVFGQNFEVATISPYVKYTSCGFQMTIEDYSWPGLPEGNVCYAVYIDSDFPNDIFIESTEGYYTSYSPNEASGAIVCFGPSFNASTTGETAVITCGLLNTFGSPTCKDGCTVTIVPGGG